jgi:hypothetical protein
MKTSGCCGSYDIAGLERVGWVFTLAAATTLSAHADLMPLSQCA